MGKVSKKPKNTKPILLGPEVEPTEEWRVMLEKETLVRTEVLSLDDPPEGALGGDVPIYYIPEAGM